MKTDLEKLCAEHRLVIETHPAFENPYMKDWTPGCRYFSVQITRKVDPHPAGLTQRAINTFFTQGPAHTSKPTVADVIHCLLADGRCGDMYYEEYCSDFGISEHNPENRVTHERCKKTSQQLDFLLGILRDTFEEAEH